MNSRWAAKIGFTVVELLVIIVVIGILATITVVSYNGIQDRGRQTAAKNDLANASKAMEIYRSQHQSYPSTVPNTFIPSQNINLEVVHDTSSHYSSITPVQSGVLFVDVCQDLISEGKGKAQNISGATDEYITSCNVYNKNQVEVHGWTSKNFSTPLSLATLNSYIDSIPSADAYHLNQQATTKNFYTELRDRYMAQGGEFPITSFWDDWASPGNGVMKEDLPAPDAPSDDVFCLQATSTADSSIVWHSTQGKSILPGPC